MTTASRRKRVIPTRAETDSQIDAMLDGAPWVDRDGVDSAAIALTKDAHYEHSALRAVLIAHPDRKTPAAAAREDALRKNFQDHLEALGLTPAARRNLGLKAASVSLGARNRAKGEAVLAYRRPADVEAFVRRLVELGIWDAVGAKFK